MNGDTTIMMRMMLPEKERRWREAGESCAAVGFLFCTHRQILSKQPNEDG